METTDFHEIFTRIKKQLIPYSKKMDARVDKDGNYQLCIVNDFEFAGRNFRECYFSGTVIQNSGWVLRHWKQELSVTSLCSCQLVPTLVLQPALARRSDMTYLDVIYLKEYITSLILRNRTSLL